MIVSSCGGQHASFANDEKEHDPPQNSRRESSRPREEKGAESTKREVESGIFTNGEWKQKHPTLHSAG